MDDRKRKLGFDVLALAGMVFLFVGLVFAVLGIVFLFVLDRSENLFLIVMFCIFGFSFVILGGSLLSVGLRKRAAMKKLIRDGNFVYAQICGIAQNTSVQINGRHPFVVECRYQDPFTGIVHIFKSRDLMFDPSGMILNPNVAVYVNPKNYDSYFVDIDTVLPMIEKH